MTEPAEYIGMPADQIDTPSLLVDLDALEHNLRTMADHFRQAGKRLRPHSKSHKTPAIAQLQLEAGAIGITCAKLGEAEAMADTGLQDVLVANEVVGPRKIERLMTLARRCDIMVAVDDPRNLADLAEAAGRAGVKPRVLVEVDIGHHRCGTGPGGAAVDLCRLAASARHLRFCGLMGYEGHIIDVEDQGKRDAGARECLQRLVDTRQAVERAGIEVPIVSSSGTGDFYVALTCAGITEVQAGSYALMDRAYGKLGLGFQHALTVLTTVTSRPAPELVITDAGMKSAPPEHGLPAVKGRDDLEVYGLSEEHGRIRCHRLPCPDQIGDRLEFIPGHGCTTVNLYDEIYAVRNGRLEAIWRIAGRGRSR